MNVVPYKALKAGRYVLDSAGKLHPMRRRYWIDAVAVVNVRPSVAGKKCRPQDIPTADDASGCEERAADPTCQSRPAAVRSERSERIVPANARQSRELIDLAVVPSSMEQRAESWRGRR